MKNIKDLGPREAIHCPTPELAKKIVELNGDIFDKFDMDIITMKGEICYDPTAKAFAEYSWYKARGYTIHQASEFLPSGEEICEHCSGTGIYITGDNERLKCICKEQSIEQPLTEDQKFFRELVVSVAGEICTASGNDWIDTTIKTAKEIFTAVKQHEAK